MLETAMMSPIPTFTPSDVIQTKGKAVAMDLLDLELAKFQAFFEEAMRTSDTTATEYGSLNERANNLLLKNDAMTVAIKDADEQVVNLVQVREDVKLDFAAISSDLEAMGKIKEKIEAHHVEIQTDQTELHARFDRIFAKQKVLREQAQEMRKRNEATKKILREVALRTDRIQQYTIQIKANLEEVKASHVKIEEHKQSIEKSFAEMRETEKKSQIAKVQKLDTSFGIWTSLVQQITAYIAPILASIGASIEFIEAHINKWFFDSQFGISDSINLSARRVFGSGEYRWSKNYV